MVQFLCYRTVRNPNQIECLLPLELKNLKRLRILYFDNNLLIDTILFTFGQLKNLIFFRLGVQPITSFTLLHLFNNQLGISSDIGSLDSLCNVNLSNNKLEEFIPSPMLHCLSFGKIDLSNKLLSGIILSKIVAYPFLSINDVPHILGTESSLSSLDLSYNNFTVYIAKYQEFQSLMICFHPIDC
ncbi:hypothetical protein Ahy_A02g006341 [Arachis hypogaea]|uniref:LRR receptor-like serine/threonine-protein kinase n=1 Tax=Arachis hypogaea TaxID=3818 RepID=A0A445EA00_ARAHY|nr:hypothetical protein Ahy_A02g006341 [Arachis hypogaea]